MTTLSPALRKAAILVSALDAAAADRLLDQMGEQQAARVRSAIMELYDVDDAEQESIVAEFFGHAPLASPSQAGVELEMSAASLQAAQDADTTPTATASTPSAGERFQFLHDTSSEQLARRLREEHPQLIALVIAHLPATKAAALLRQLPSVLQQEVLERLHHFDDEADSETLAQLESELERMFAGELRSCVFDSKRQRHVEEIVQQLRKTPGGESLANHTLPEPQSTPPSLELPTPSIPFETLLTFAAADFFAVFEEADPRYVMLALAGSSRRMFERYTSQFSTDRALEFERHLEQLRPLRLRDVEVAQRELATLAGRRLQTAKVAAETSRRFAAAA